MQCVLPSNLSTNPWKGAGASSVSRVLVEVFRGDFGEVYNKIAYLNAIVAPMPLDLNCALHIYHYLPKLL